MSARSSSNRLADCLHAVHDQAKLAAGQSLVVIACGVMGLKIIAEAARIGVRVLVVEPLAARRELALELRRRESDRSRTTGWTRRRPGPAARVPMP